MTGQKVREIKHIKGSDRIERTIDCAYCDKPSLVISSTGLMSWESPHGKDGREKHPSVYSILNFFTWYIEKANRAVLINLRQRIDEQLEKLAA